MPSIALEWTPHLVGMLKVNVDGASFGNPGLAGYGCVLRDSDGQIIWVKAGPIGVWNAVFVEVMVMLKGLRLLKAKDLRDCVVEGDSMTMFSWENGGGCGS